MVHHRCSPSRDIVKCDSWRLSRTALSFDSVLSCTVFILTEDCSQQRSALTPFCPVYILYTVQCSSWLGTVPDNALLWLSAVPDIVQLDSALSQTVLNQSTKQKSLQMSKVSKNHLFPCKRKPFSTKLFEKFKQKISWHCALLKDYQETISGVSLSLHPNEMALGTNYSHSSGALSFS